MCSGQTYEVFHDLLGAPSFYFKTNDNNIWKILLEGEKKNFIMAATALPQDQEKQRMEDLGIMSFTSYSVNKAVEIYDKNHKKVKLL